ncbi:MAG: DUF3592 domain-containing protein [Ruminococcus sp.]|nr:DUF3592 domain-containing protein [Ruminococcus sp.]
MRVTLHRTNNLKVVGVFFIIFSVLFILVGMFVSFVPKINAKKCTETVMAEVVDNAMTEIEIGYRNRRRSTVNYSPVFQFEYNGEEYTVRSNTSSSSPAYQVGENVELKIDPDDPNDFYAPSDRTFSLIGIIFSIVGGIFLILGITAVVSSAKKNKNGAVE